MNLNSSDDVMNSMTGECIDIMSMCEKGEFEINSFACVCVRAHIHVSRCVLVDFSFLVLTNTNVSENPCPKRWCQCVRLDKNLDDIRYLKSEGTHEALFFPQYYY